MRFEFATASRIIFGNGAAEEIAPLAAEKGGRAFLITGRNTNRARPLMDDLEKAGVIYKTFSISGEPTTEILSDCLARARAFQGDLVITFGGGSVIDTGKAVSALLTNPGDIMDYLEVIGHGRKLVKTPAFHVAVPTTAGTGAEVTRNAVLRSLEYGIKVSMRSPLMLPDIAVVDPDLTISMPQEVTASTGLDALTQLMEAFVSKKANPLTDGLCREGLKRAARSLYDAYKDGNNRFAREDMALASLFGGLALANSGLGAVHGFAGPIGGMFSAPHGVICARLLSHVVEINTKALRSRLPDSPALERYNELGRILTGKNNACMEDCAEWISDLCGVLKVFPLFDYGLESDQFSELIEKARKSSSMKGNPVELTDHEMLEILNKV
jgi:alcohol dehydrogenase class IV